MQFDAPETADALFSLNAPEEADSFEFGVIGLNEDDEVVVYNTAESKFAGLPMDSVLGKDFFTEVAPCMNNYMVAQRMEDEAAVDDVIDYVLTLKMKPTNVKLRILKRDDEDLRFILVHPS